MTIDIPVRMLKVALRLTGAKTKREAILAAVHDFNRRRSMDHLVRHFGTRLAGEEDVRPRPTP